MEEEEGGQGQGQGEGEEVGEEDRLRGEKEEIDGAGY